MLQIVASELLRLWDIFNSKMKCIHSFLVWINLKHFLTVIDVLRTLKLLSSTEISNFISQSFHLLNIVFCCLLFFFLRATYQIGWLRVQVEKFCIIKVSSLVFLVLVFFFSLLNSLPDLIPNMMSLKENILNDFYRIEIGNAAEILASNET